MTRTHTSGPWTVDHGEFHIRIRGSGVTICELFPTRRKEPLPLETFVANASLIAASPDMLEELVKAREIVVKWCSYQGKTEEVYNQYLNSIDTVILKARGQQ